MTEKLRCAIQWCPSTAPLLRRKADTPFFKRFGQAVLCSTHVPPWRRDEYEPVDAPPPVPQEQKPPEPARSPEFDKVGAQERVREKRAARTAKKEEPASPPVEDERDNPQRGGEESIAYPPDEKAAHDRAVERVAKARGRTAKARGEGAPF